jgi:hypothetical protein
MTARVGVFVRGALTALTALVLAHNLIFLAGYGDEFGDVMARTGHDHGWTITVVVSLLLGLALLAGAVWRLRQLRSIARSLGATHMPTEPGRGAFLRRWTGSWIALSIVVAALFVLQENRELASVGQHQPGIGVLTSAAYPNALLIIAAVAMAVSFVAVLLGWKIDLVIARIVAMRGVAPGASEPVFRPRERINRRRRSILGGRRAGRAPPSGAAQLA